MSMIGFDVRKLVEYWKQVLVLFGLLICVGLLLLLRGQSMSRLQGLRAEDVSNQTEIAQLQATLNALPALTPKQTAAARLLLPKSVDVPQVLRETSRVAQQAKVTVSTFQFSPEPSSTGDANSGTANKVATNAMGSFDNATLQALGLQAYSVNVTVNGSMSGVLGFINALQHYPRLSVVQSATWQSTRGQNQVAILFNVYVNPSPSAP